MSICESRKGFATSHFRQNNDCFGNPRIHLADLLGSRFQAGHQVMELLALYRNVTTNGLRCF